MHSLYVPIHILIESFFKSSFFLFCLGGALFFALFVCLLGVLVFALVYWFFGGAGAHCLINKNTFLKFI